MGTKSHYVKSSNRSKGTVKLIRPGKDPEYKFPMKDKGQAGNAMARMNQAKPALPTQIKKHVAREAKKVLGHETSAIKRILGL